MAALLKDEKKEIAKESYKTKRAREKLKKKLEAIDLEVTEQALEQKTIEIHRWIARHAPYRVVLRTKNISLFDENQNTAKLSKRVEGIALKVQEQSAAPPMSLKDRNIEKK